MARRRKRKTKSERTKGLKLRLPFKKHTALGIIQISLISLSGLVLVSFSRQGNVLVRLNDYLVLYFGWSSIFIPFILLSLGFSFTKLVRVPLGEPNVIVGSILFFVSVATLTRAGFFGRSSWDGVVTLITAPGAAVVLAGTTLTGIIILFNTSFDRVLLVFASFLKLLRKYLVGEPGTASVGSKSVFQKRRSELRVVGGGQNYNQQDEKSIDSTQVRQVKEKGSDELSQKLVSNMPGEERLWSHPPLSLLSDTQAGKADRGDIKGNADTIEETLGSFGIKANVVEVNLGPAVTQYALEVALGTKLSKITALERDLALSLAAPTGTVRIEAPIPGRNLVGIELPNRSPEFVPMKKMLTSSAMDSDKSKLTVALGLDVAGNPIAADISKMPHVLIAGQTGSGKSVCLNAFLSSILFRASPSEVKLILVDPKRVELTGYNDIPHMLAPVIVEPEKVVSALRWILSEMDRRYKLFAQAGVRNIAGYNEMSGFQALPYIVLVVDELADVMLFSPVEVEDSVTRIAQMSRATGIHMVLATQRPSVDVITGLIKANIPCRIAFAVSSQVDSRVILDTQGAEKLLGRGDMLYLAPDQAKPTRIQGAFISDKDTQALTSFLKNQGISPQYTDEVVSMPKPGSTSVSGVDGDVDELFKEAVEIVCQYEKASASLLQRRLAIGYSRAARIIDQLQDAGVVGAADASKPREVLIQSPSEIFGSSGESGIS